MVSDYGWRLPVSILFLNESWNAHVIAGSNAAYWSLSYEITYYALFGVAIFMRGPARLGWVLVIAVIAGPRIIALLPAWLSGFLAYRISGKNFIKANMRMLYFATSTVVLLAAFVATGIWGVFSRANAVFNYGVSELFQANVLAILLAVHLVCADRISEQFGWLIAGRRLVRWSSASTFGLYLFHMPIMVFVAASLGPPAGSMARGLLMAGITFLVAITLAQITEPQKYVWQRAFAAVFNWLGPLTTRAEHLARLWLLTRRSRSR